MRIFVLIITLAFFCLSTSSAFAHIEHGGMPDSVAEMEYRILLEFEPQKHDIRNKLGDVLFRLKKYKESRSEFQAVLASEPDNLQAHIGLGQLLIHDQNWLEAENLFLKLQEKHSDNPELAYFLALVYKETGKTKKAEKILNEALKTTQNDKSEEALHIIEKINQTLVDIKVSDNDPASKTSQ